MAVTDHRTRNHANMYGFARHATGYDLLSGVLARPLYRRVVADVIECALPARSVVLDVGTGPGRVVRLIAAACPEVDVTGIDLSPEMIARATSTAKTTSTRNLRFEVADVAALPFADSSVDLVVSTLSLHHGTTRRQASTRSFECSLPAHKLGSMTSAPRLGRRTGSAVD